jgi:hypothetical protein
MASNHDFFTILSRGMEFPCELSFSTFILMPLTSLMNISNFPLFVVCQSIFWMFSFLPTFYFMKRSKGNQNKDDVVVDVKTLFISLAVFYGIFCVVLVVLATLRMCNSGEDVVDSFNPISATSEPAFSHLPS